MSTVLNKPEAKEPMFRTGTVPRGEPMVWFTSVGLTVGLAMIVFLLGLIVVKGLHVFWPKPVALVQLTEGSDAGIRGALHVAGTIERRQERKLLTSADIGKNLKEWQLFTGNKEVYGFSFKYIDVDQIVKVTHPSNILRLERMEYGDALVVPVALKSQSRGIVGGEDPGFRKALAEATRQSNERWKRIREIEKGKIGSINYRMEKLRIRQVGLGRRGGNENKLAKIDEVLATLQADYEKLAMEARMLRDEQDNSHLIYRLATGQEKELSMGDVVSFYYPNQMSFFDRVGHFFRRIWVFVSEDPREANTEGGVFPAIFGTFVMTVMMSVAVTPFGVLAAIYLREYAKQGFLVRSVRIAVNNLAGVPSIVFGVFGLGFFVYFLGGNIDQLFFKDALPNPTFGTGGILWASMTLALLTVPVVIVSTEEALASVPRGMREGSLACGASKWQTIQRIVLPAAAPGILTGLILAMARGASEVAPLMLVGVVKLAPSMPVDGIFPFFHLERKFMHLGFHIYDLGFQSPDSEAAKPMVFATTLLLISLVVLLNLGAIIIREKLRKKYATGAF